MQILIGHISPETAYIVEDYYPYEFRLRCKIRYWLDSNPNKGTRFVSQITNPKKNNIWNKEKYSTYMRFGGCMILDDNNHVTWIGISEYIMTPIAEKWVKMYDQAQAIIEKETQDKIEEIEL